MQHARALKRGWLVLLVPLLAIVVLGHLFVFCRLSSHLAWIVVAALVLLLVAAHLGVFGAIYAVFKRRRRGEW